MKKNVLFVCLGNSCRSQMAEGFAKEFGKDVVNAESAGLCATHSVARETIAVMQEVGIDITEHFPKDFEPAWAARYDVIVNMSGFELPPVSGPLIVEWDIRDPNGAEMRIHREIRDEVAECVSALVADLRENGTITRRDTPAAVGQRIASDVVRRARLWQRFTRWF